MLISVRYVYTDFSSSRQHEVVDDLLGTELIDAIGNIDAVITFYHSKNLDVLPNIIKALMYLHQQDAQQPMVAIAWNKLENKRYAQYAKAVDEQISKLLLLC